MSKPTTFVVVEIGAKAYDYPQYLPMPRIGERISVGDSNIVRIVDVLYQVSFDKKGKNILNNITIRTQYE